MSTTAEENNGRGAALPSPLCFTEARGLFKFLGVLERVRIKEPEPALPCRIPVAVEDNIDEGSDPETVFSTSKPRESSDHDLRNNEEDKGKEDEDNLFPMESMQAFDSSASAHYRRLSRFRLRDFQRLNSR